MGIHLAEEDGHLSKGGEYPRGIVIANLAGIFPIRFVTAGMGFGFYAPVSAKGSQHGTGILSCIIDMGNRGDSIGDFIGHFLCAICGLYDPPNGKDLADKRECHFFAGDGQAAPDPGFDTRGIVV